MRAKLRAFQAAFTAIHPELENLENQIEINEAKLEGIRTLRQNLDNEIKAKLAEAEKVCAIMEERVKAKMAEAEAGVDFINKIYADFYRMQKTEVKIDEQVAKQNKDVAAQKLADLKKPR